MAEPLPTLLIVEDDLDVADMLNAYFHKHGYEVITVNWGEDALLACRTRRPALIILDIRLPDIDGFEVARRLRSNRRTEDIPIIFLTEQRTRNDRLQGLEIGADDYVTKPFDFQELRLRVRNALRRVSEAPLSNPVTKMPEGALVDERLIECLESESWSLLLISLRNLDAFRDSYGFVAADDVLRAISLMIRNAVREVGSLNDFISHFDQDSFLVVTAPENADALVGRIRERLDQSLEYFYPLRDRLDNRAGKERLNIDFRRLDGQKDRYSNVDELRNALKSLPV